jgi:hypothetical protein
MEPIHLNQVPEQKLGGGSALVRSLMKHDINENLGYSLSLPAVDECEVLALLEELGPAPPVNTPEVKEPPTLSPPEVLDPSEPGLERSNLSDITLKGSLHIRPSLNKNAK